MRPFSTVRELSALTGRLADITGASMVYAPSLYRRGLITTAALTVIAAAIGSPASADEARVNLAQAVKRTVLVFPVDMPDNGPANKDDVSQLITDTIVSRLQASGQYTVIQYHKTLPPVARLHLDQQLTDTDVAPPFAQDTAKATKITKLTGYDVAFMGAVDEYTYNEADNQADVVVRGQLLDVKTGKNLGAPVILKDSSSKGGMAKEPAKALEAARAAGSQLAQKLIPISSTPVTQPTNPITKAPSKAPQKKKHNNTGLLLGLLAIGLGLGIGLASSGGGHGGGNGGDLPPSPP
jgi:hypothetical protein